MSEKNQKDSSERNGFLRIASDLTERIESGVFQAGTLLPTEKMLQDEYGISRTTVRRALNRLIDSGWAKAIPHRGVMVMGGIVPSGSRRIAFVYGTTYVQKVLASRFESLFKSQGYAIESISGYSADQGSKPLEQAATGEFAGAIVWNSFGFTDPEVVRNLASNVPVVSLVHELPDPRVDRVGFDEFEAAYQATVHLAAQGCKRIAITGMLDMLQTSHDRFSGYLKGIFDSGNSPQVSDFVFCQTSGSEAQDTSALYNRLRDHDHPDGLLVINDMCSQGAIQACMRAGLRLPEDVKVVTLGDDVDLTVNGLGMSTVAFDWDALANMACETLLDRIKNSIRPARVCFAPHQLIIRGLCGAPRVEWTENPELESGFHGNTPIPRFRYRFSSSWSVEETVPS